MGELSVELEILLVAAVVVSSVYKEISSLLVLGTTGVIMEMDSVDDDRNSIGEV